MKADKAEREKAIHELRELIKPGDTVYTILDSVSRSGMSRTIRTVLPYTTDDGKIDHLHPNYSIALAIQARQAKRGDGIIMGGCGMDMGYALVYELSHVLYGGRLTTDIYPDDAATINKDGSGELLTREGAPEGKIYIGGYRCLGKGKCPSNYHTNHRDTIHCEGTRQYNPDGPDTGFMCYKPDAFSRFPIPEDWPRRREAIPVEGDDAYEYTVLLACLLDGGEERHDYTVCPTCVGVGHLPNPDGPERFDLVHMDGYALRHRWL